VNLAWPKTLTYPKHWARDPVTAMIAGEATKTIGRVVSLNFFLKKKSSMKRRLAVWGAISE
jgi:hypothetical protein